MKFIGFYLESHSESSNVINGIRFSLKVKDFTKIIDNFKLNDKWTEYYFYENSDYDLNVYEINSILNLEGDYWKDYRVKFDFSGFNVDYDERSTKNCLIFQSYDRKSNAKSHFYRCWSDDEIQIKDNNIDDSQFITDTLCKSLENLKRIFDIKNYRYKLEKVRLNELYLPEKDKDLIRLNISEDYTND